MIYSIAVCAAVVAGFLLVGNRLSAEGRAPSLWRPFPIVTLVSLLVIGGVSVLQLTVFPSLLANLERDRHAIAGGQVWRIVTAVITQDGGWVGLTSNLITLALIGVVAEQILHRRAWLVAFWVPVVFAEFVGLAWQPMGAGNSVGVAGLCGAVAVEALRSWPSKVPAAISIVAWVVLAVEQDIHGAAGVAGVVVGLAICGYQVRQRRGINRVYARHS